LKAEKTSALRSLLTLVLVLEERCHREFGRFTIAGFRRLSNPYSLLIPHW
jgi:hypothetical protein